MKRQKHERMTKGWSWWRDLKEFLLCTTIVLLWCIWDEGTTSLLSCCSNLTMLQKSSSRRWDNNATWLLASHIKSHEIEISKCWPNHIGHPQFLQQGVHLLVQWPLQLTEEAPGLQALEGHVCQLKNWNSSPKENVAVCFIFSQYNIQLGTQLHSFRCWRQHRQLT